MMRGSRNTNDVCQPLVFPVPPSEWIDASNAPSCKVVLAPTLGPMLRSNAMNAPRGSLTPILVCWGNFERSSFGIAVFVVRFESVRREIAPISGRHNRVLIGYGIISTTTEIRFFSSSVRKRRYWLEVRTVFGGRDAQRV